MVIEKLSPREVRTFGDLLRSTICGSHSGLCSCCKQYGYQDRYYYSTRHRICRGCIAKRHDEVMPGVRKHEAFQRRMKALRPFTPGPYLMAGM